MKCLMNLMQKEYVTRTKMKEFENIICYLENGLYHLEREEGENLEELYESITRLFYQDFPVLAYSKHNWEIGLNLPNYVKRNEPTILLLKDADIYFKGHKEFLFEVGKNCTVIIDSQKSNASLIDIPACGVIKTSKGLEIFTDFES